MLLLLVVVLVVGVVVLLLLLLRRRRETETHLSYERNTRIMRVAESQMRPALNETSHACLVLEFGSSILDASKTETETDTEMETERGRERGRTFHHLFAYSTSGLGADPRTPSCW